MANERNDKPVKVTLDRRRAFHLNETDRRAQWVGPGEVEVPHYVAEHWGLVEATEAETRKEPKAPAIPRDAVSATVETVETVEQPQADSQATETSKRSKGGK